MGGEELNRSWLHVLSGPKARDSFDAFGLEKIIPNTSLGI